MRSVVLSGSLLCSLLASAAPALAQRADENAVTSAADAFGTRIGEENIGLYSEGDVRGFDPSAAGNTRIDGMYFDIQGAMSGRIFSGDSIHVGISAQGYPFPAPSGIVDFNIRALGTEPVLSVMAGTMPLGGYRFSADGVMPVTGDKLSIGGGASAKRTYFRFSQADDAWSAGLLARWRPAENVEIVPFFSYAEEKIHPGEVYMIPTGDVLPAKIARGADFLQPWSRTHNLSDMEGVVATVKPGAGWVWKTAIFRARAATKERIYSLFLTGNDPDRTEYADYIAVADPASHYTSWSGETRLSKTMTTGDVRHTAYFMVRGRQVRGLYGGSDSVDEGTVRLGEKADLPEPVFTFGAQTRDKVRQGSAGIAYEGQWGKIAEFGLGVQRARLVKTVTAPDAAPDRHEDNLWLYNGSLAIHATEKLAFYGSFARGLEQNDTAPTSATNRGEVLTAIRTQQRDAGIRYAITPKVSFIAGYFDVRRPYYDLNKDNLFTGLGTVRHEGFELSLSGEAAKGLNVVAGAVLMNPKVEADANIAEAVGARPAARPRTVLQGSVDYRLPFVEGASVDVDATWTGRSAVNTANTLWADSRYAVNLGARYRFKVGKAPATMRLRLENLTDHYGWKTYKGGILYPITPRQFSFYITADV